MNQQSLPTVQANGVDSFDGYSQATELPPLLRYWNMMMRHRWLGIGIVIASLVAGILLTLIATPQYTATSRIEIARQQQRITNVQGVESEEAGRDLEFYFTQYALLEARSLASRVSQRLNLARSDDFFEANSVSPEDTGFFDVGSSSALDSEALQARETLVVETLIDRLTVNPIRSSALVDISYTSASPSLSAQISNAWVEEFISQSMDRRFESTADARRFLESRLDGLRERVEASERELVNYAAEKGIVRLGEDGAIARNSDTLRGTKVRQLNESLAAATAVRAAAEGELNAARARGSNERALQNPALNKLQEELATAESQYAQLMVQFEPEYPAAIALQERIDSLQRSISRLEARTLDTFATNFEATRASEQAIRERLSSALATLGEEQRASIQYNIFQREADTNRQLYDGLLQRYKEIGVAGVAANNISVVDIADVPDEPSSPRLLINLLIALAAGAGLAVASVFVLENLDEGLREPDEVRNRLRLPLLGAIPIFESDNIEELLADSKSDLSDAYFTVRTNLNFSTNHGLPRSLSTASTSPSEGKSVTSVALASIISRTGRKTVLVDADLRKPNVHSFFEFDNTAGTSNYLAGADSIEELVNKTHNSNLDVITAGRQPPNPSELLGGDRFEMMVAVLLERYDHVVVDGPPMLGFADAPLIANAVEGVVYVVEARRTPVRAASLALRRLHEAHANLFGVVLTKYKPSDSGYGYGYGYGYGDSDPETAT